MDLNNFFLICLRFIFIINQIIWGIVLSYSYKNKDLLIISYFISIAPNFILLIFENITWFFRTKLEYLYYTHEPCKDGLNSKSLIIIRSIVIIISTIFLIFWIIYDDDSLFIPPFIFILSIVLSENIYPCLLDEHNNKWSKLLCCKNKYMTLH